MAGAVNASIPAAMKKAAPTPMPEAPRSSRRSGISTSKAPESTDGRTTSQNANSTGALRIAVTTERTPGTPPGAIPGTESTQTAKAAATTATPQKTTSGPVTVAIPPITGPSRMPKIAAASAAPIVFAPPIGRRGGQEPPQSARPGAGAADALGEARRVEHRDAVAERERDARDPQQRQPHQHRGAETVPGREEPGGDRRDQRPSRVGGAERPRRRPSRSPRSSAYPGSSGVIAA